jgi:amidase
VVTGCEVVSPSDVPADLLDAFWGYDKALLSNDQETLNRSFAPGPDTVRGDGTNLVVGHDAIASFRSGRTRIPTRQVIQLHVRMLGTDAALVVARTRDGLASGLQTQLWQRISGDWLVSAAHVSLPTASVPFDRSIWRIVGEPLVGPTASGRLDGLGVAVKDLFAVAGHPVGAGNPDWLAEQSPATESAAVVDALLAAGAHVTGIARTDEFAYSLAGANVHYGTPPNPAVPHGLSGGSSSGPASAVATGQVAIGLGTDTGGSVRVPASYQGLVGIRTTHGVVPRGGMLPLAPSFDTVGWLTRDVTTSLLVAEVLLPESTVNARRTVRLPRIEALARDDLEFGAAIDRLVAAGALPPVESVDLPDELLERWFAAFRTVQGYEAWQADGAWIEAHPGSLGADIAARFAVAARITDAEQAAARGVVAAARHEITEWLADSVLVIPAASGPAPARTAPAAEIEEHRAGTLRMTCLAGLSGAPAVSVPLLRSGSYPVGLCLISTPGTDRGLLELAARVVAA